MKPPKKSRTAAIGFAITTFIIVCLQSFSENYKAELNQYYNGTAFENAVLKTFFEALIDALIAYIIVYSVQEYRWIRFAKQFPDGIPPVLNVNPPIKYSSSRIAIIAAIAVVLLILMMSIYLVYY